MSSMAAIALLELLPPSKPSRGVHEKRRARKRWTLRLRAVKMANPRRGGEVSRRSMHSGNTSTVLAAGIYSVPNLASEPLAALLDTDKMSRPQVVKRIWEYIKENNLQNPADRREIMCDDKLKSVFGIDKIGMFKMNKALGEHLYEPTA
ncbi:hypothetical protein NM688_g5429 [Phlebia brevispora]|uniref:Uncharacterized protein n=1 Tax=Phlebia brevispora TaxID=194682 RepID=A0ACC1SVD1_9APHY|nr:hypothetical protein NM688_g5429 [Phlebia brevispora]